MPSFASGSTQVVLLTPQEVTADGNSVGLDIADFRGEVMVVLTGKSNAGTNPTMACKLQHAQDTDRITSVTPGSNTGNGTCTQVYAGPDSVAETITVSFTNATTFTVTGGTTGAMAGGTVGTLYQTQQVEFMITAGSAAFINGDTFAIVTTATTYSDVGSGAFTGMTSTGSIQRLAVNSDKLGRYLRLNMDIGGTNTPKFTLAATIYGQTT